METKELRELSSYTEKEICMGLLGEGKEVEVHLAILRDSSPEMKIIYSSTGDEIFVDNEDKAHEICHENDCNCEKIHQRDIIKKKPLYKVVENKD